MYKFNFLLCLVIFVFVLLMVISSVFVQLVFDMFVNGFCGQVSSCGENVVFGIQVDVIGCQFVLGQWVILLCGDMVFNVILYVVDEQGNFKVIIVILVDVVLGQYLVVVCVSQFDVVVVLLLWVLLNLLLSGQQVFNQLLVKFVQGLYQSVYSLVSNVVFVMLVVGCLLVIQLQLFKVDLMCLNVFKVIILVQVFDVKGGSVFVVYGVGVDDVNGYVWVINICQDIVVVYWQLDLGLVYQFLVGIVLYVCDVVVDIKCGKVIVLVIGEDYLLVFDVKIFKVLELIMLVFGVDDGKFVLMSLVFDEVSGKLFIVSIGMLEVVVIDVVSGKVDKVIVFGNLISVFGVVYDVRYDCLFVVLQGSDNLLIVDVVSGKVLYDVLVGVGVFNVVFELVFGLVYVINCGVGMVIVVNGEGRIVGNFDGGIFFNYVCVDGKGNVFVVNKLCGVEDFKGDCIMCFVLCSQ